MSIARQLRRRRLYGREPPRDLRGRHRPREGTTLPEIAAESRHRVTLLRQAIALYSERFPVLLRLSAVAYLPLFLFLIVIAVLDARGLSSSPTIGVIVIFGMIAMNVGSYLAIPALVTPVVYQSFVAPLRPASLSDVWNPGLGRYRPRWQTLGCRHR